jgi:RNA polymerase sigma-70 factor, ECF subfamily
VTAERSDAAAALAGAVAADHARMMGAVIASVRDWQVAEDALQDACERALVVWERDGVPANPAAWLVTTARRRSIDLLRRADGRTATAHRYGEAVERGMLDRDPDETGLIDDLPVDDDRLRLVLTCVHPALPIESRVALTLRTVLGLPPADIARLFLTGTPAMEKRLVRARAKIAHAGIPYRVPGAAELPARVESALGVVYLLFTSGYADPARAELMAEALRLGLLLEEVLPAGSPEPRETSGLLALMAVQRARQSARFDDDGTAVLLDAQDRTRWDRAAITAAGHRIADITQAAAHLREPVGPYTLQAAIALEHARPDDAADTDWVRIASLHALLARIAGSPAQRIAWAIATGRAHGPDAGLRILDAIEGADDLHLLHAARADLLERAGRTDEARDAYLAAAALAPTDGERVALAERAAALA